MKSVDAWQPTKYIHRNGALVASRDPAEVAVGSRLITDVIAKFYSTYLPLHARGRLLDLGCGKVPLFGAYRKYVDESICVDWGNSLHKNSHLDFECDLTQPLPFTHRSFDTIILSDVLEHMPEPELLWAEMARILRPGGTLLMNVPFFYWLHEHPHDYYRYTEFALRRFVQRAGLDLHMIEAVAGAPEIIADILAKNLVRVPAVGVPVAGFVQWFTGLLCATRLGHRISAATARNFPLGYFLVVKKGSAAPGPL